MAYKFLPHTSDIKFQASGDSIEQAFSSAADALKQTIAGKIKIKDKEERRLNIKGNDFESLLYNFLEEFLYLLDAENFLFNKIKDINIDKKNLRLKVIISGDNVENYRFTNHVKAITYNDMFIKKERDKYLIQVVLDV